MERVQSSIPWVLTVVLASCYYDYDYELISLESSMNVIGIDRTERHDVRNHEQMPMNYSLVRDRYILYADIHKNSNRPAVVFSIKALIGNDLKIIGHPIRCNAHFDPVRSGQARRYGFPEDGYVFEWAPGRVPECFEEHLPAGPDRKLTISVYNERGNLIDVEELTFEIITNGIRRENDSL